ncbi:MAG: hypothetical protein RLZZ427_159, partial [Pseudomonadota bacterium]
MTPPPVIPAPALTAQRRDHPTRNDPMKTLICTSILTFAALPAAAWAQVGDTGTVAIDGRV